MSCLQHSQQLCIAQWPALSANVHWPCRDDRTPSRQRLEVLSFIRPSEPVQNVVKVFTEQQHM